MTMKNLRDQFKTLLIAALANVDGYEDGKETVFLNNMIQAVGERDKKSVGSHVTHSCSCRKDEEDTYCSCGADEINEVKDEIARSLQQTLGDAEDWTRNSI